MNTTGRTVLVAALAATLFSSALSAQSRSGFAQGSEMKLGPAIGVGTNSLDFMIGAQFAYPVADRFDIYPSFQYYFPGNSVHVWTLDGSVRYWPKLNIKNSGLYAGAGINYTHTSVSVSTPLGTVSGSSSDAGLSLFGGWEFKMQNFFPFGQIRVVVGNADRVDFMGGVNFRL